MLKCLSPILIPQFISFTRCTSSWYTRLKSIVRWWNPVLLHVPLSIAYRVSHWGGPSRTSNCTSGRGVARRGQVTLRLVWKRTHCVEYDRRHLGHRDCSWIRGSHACWNVRSHHALALLSCLFHDQWQTQTGRDGADVVGTIMCNMCSSSTLESVTDSVTGGSCWRDVLLSRSCIAGLKHRVGTCPGRDHGVDRLSE